MDLLSSSHGIRHLIQVQAHRELTYTSASGLSPQALTSGTNCTHNSQRRKKDGYQRRGKCPWLPSGTREGRIGWMWHRVAKPADVLRRNEEMGSGKSRNKMGNPSNGPAAVTWFNTFCLGCYGSSKLIWPHWSLVVPRTSTIMALMVIMALWPQIRNL